MKTLTIGSRGSQLALLQSRQIADFLLVVYPNLDIQINIIRTEGDKNLDKPLNEIGGKAVFTAELEEALIKHHIDLAVHSLKDLPSSLPGGLNYLGSPQREDARDVFISTKWKTIDEIPEGGTIATGSVRRKAQLLHHRSDYNIQGLRGNLDTRLRKLDDNNWDGIITAAAAMHRIGLKDRISQYLDPECFVPAGGQGALGLEIAADREDVKTLLSTIINEDITRCCKAERLYIAQIEGSCFSPIGCWARIENDVFLLTGYSANLDGSKKLQETVKGDIMEAENLALQLADNMRQNGVQELMVK